MSEANSISIPQGPAIAFVGNPDAGISTLLNELTGSPRIRSDPSLCGGLTQVLQAFSVGNLTLYGTLGFLDGPRIKQAGKELDKLLSENVALKIVFVITLNVGRVRRSDTLIVRHALDAISVDTNDRFGVIITKMEKKVEAKLRDPEEECKMRKLLTGDRNTSHWCYVPMETSLFGAKDDCHMAKALNLLLHALPVAKPLCTVGSSVNTQNLAKLLEAAELHVSEIENAKEEELREVTADYELQKLDFEKKISTLKQALLDEKSKNSEKSKEVENIEEEKREESVADDLGVPFVAIQEGGQTEEEGGYAKSPPRGIAMAGDLIRVNKRELVIPVDDGAGRGHGDTIRVTNLADNDIAFKMKTTNRNRYIVRPNAACVPRGESTDIRVILSPATAVPAPGASKDRFQLRVALAPGLSEALSPAEFWREHEEDEGQLRIRFGVKFVPFVVAPAAPVAANRLVSDRFGGLSVISVGLVFVVLLLLLKLFL